MTTFAGMYAYHWLAATGIAIGLVLSLIVEFLRRDR